MSMSPVVDLELEAPVQETTVVLVDGLAREGVKAILCKGPSIRVVGKAADAGMVFPAGCPHGILWVLTSA